LVRITKIKIFFLFTYFFSEHFLFSKKRYIFATRNKTITQNNEINKNT